MSKWTGKKATCQGSTETVHDMYNKVTYAASGLDSGDSGSSAGIFERVKSMNNFRIKTGDSSFLNPISDEVEARNMVLLKQEEIQTCECAKQGSDLEKMVFIVVASIQFV